MKNNLKIFSTLAAFVLIGAFAVNNFAQIKTGGYKKIAKTDAAVVAAANFAVKAQAKKQKSKIKLVTVNNAARQVVAGMNYQMCLSVETTDRKKKTAAPQFVQVVVYQNIKNKYSLTSWTIAACADAESSN